jgi:hypothetical protein
VISRYICTLYFTISKLGYSWNNLIWKNTQTNDMLGHYSSSPFVMWCFLQGGKLFAFNTKFIRNASKYQDLLFVLFSNFTWYTICRLCYEKFDTIPVIWRRTNKKKWPAEHTHKQRMVDKIMHRKLMIVQHEPTINGVELRCLGKLGSSCFTSGTRRVIQAITERKTNRQCRSFLSSDSKIPK